MKQKTIAFLPIRKGSQVIPLKNFKKLAGKPLFCWVGEAVINCPEISELIISTDFEEIKSTTPKFFKSPKIKIFRRTPETATNTASTESAIFDYIDREHPDFDYFLLIQATCPFTTSEDLTKAVQKIKQTNADSLLTLVPQKKFYWEMGKKGLVEPINYSPLKRPLKQEMDFQYWENGAFYITKKEALLTSKCRISGKIVGFPIDAPMDIDDPTDWTIAEKLLLEREQAT